MSLLEAVRLALAQIRVQKLKSFFTLAGVTIGVMFLIAVVSIVEGMSRYVENDFIGRILGANTFTLRRFPWFGNNTTREQWREWQKRPRFYQKDVRAIVAVLPNGTRWAVESGENLWATSPFARPRQVDAHAVEGDYFTIKKYDLSNGRVFTQQEAELGAAVVIACEKTRKVMTTVGTALPLIGLIVGGMVIMNIMLVAVAERTREIGIRKSLGARRRDILGQFLAEAATLSTLGALIGIALGIAIAKGIAWKFPFLPAAVAPWSLVAATMLGLVVGIVSGVYPARRAARLDPIEALRQE